MRRSPRAGGCTFAEDPAHSCAVVRPIWTAIADPCVVAVRTRSLPQAIDWLAGSATHVRRLGSASAQHLLIERGTATIRLDIVEHRAASAPVAFELPDDDCLDARIEAIRSLRAAALSDRRHLQLALRLRALEAVDAREAGASLRKIADLLLGPGDWPGDGEHRKSMARRLIATGDRMLKAGPLAVLANPVIGHRSGRRIS